MLNEKLIKELVQLKNTKVSKDIDIKLSIKKSFWIVNLYVLVFSLSLVGLIYIGKYIDFSGQWFIKARQYALLGYLIDACEFLKYQPFDLYIWILFILLAGIFIFTWSIWLVSARTFSLSFKELLNDSNAKGQSENKSEFIDQRIEQERKSRLFLHMMSILQREGRLLDFFDQDLNQYDDEQIGSAVRSIQDDCKKAIKKYIDPRPIIDSEEGELVIIEKGFDMNAIHLVGNVVGDPPFKGFLRHQGWKAGKKGLPKLLDVQDATIITPAEVKI